MGQVGWLDFSFLVKDLNLHEKFVVEIILSFNILTVLELKLIKGRSSSNNQMAGREKNR